VSEWLPIRGEIAMTPKTIVDNISDSNDTDEDDDHFELVVVFGFAPWYYLFQKLKLHGLDN
jgi:hypothetical protein